MTRHRANDPEAVRKAQEKAQEDRTLELEDITAILSTAPGLRFFQRLFLDGHVMTTTFSGNAPTTYFREGERNLALRYLNDVYEAAPEMVVQVIFQKDSGNE
jgi:hypothetical protein